MTYTSQSDTIELGHVARTVVRGWRAVLAFTLFGLLAAVAIILFALYMTTVVALVIIGTFFRGHEFGWDWGWVLGNPQCEPGTKC